MSHSKTEIVSGIDQYVAESCYPYRAGWYVGIATDVKRRLFNDHNVSERAGKWIYMLATSKSTAREAEAELLSMGYDGGPGGGDKPLYVYAFHKESYTDPKA